MIDYPRITVVMPSFNQARFLEEAICSVLDQNYPNLEFMILDGGSTDGSREIIERYSDNLVYWRSMPDDGQSSAIAEGMTRATGELAGWLNTDDLLLPGALEAIANAHLRNPKGGLFAGNLMFINSQGLVTGFLRMPSNADWFARKGVFAVSGPGSFYRVDDYYRVGGIRPDLHYAMDNELYLRILLAGVKFVYIDRYIAAFRRHQGQKTSANRDKIDAEVSRLDRELRERGLSYRATTALMLYFGWQCFNGNYLKKQIHLWQARGKHWRTWIHDSSNVQSIATHSY